MSFEDVLIIDDDEICCLMLQERLKQIGLTASYILHGTQSITAIHETRPKLIILDMYLPTIDGFEIHRKIQQQKEEPIYIIAISSDPRVLECIGHLGANEVFLKQDIDAILQAISFFFKQ